MTAFLGRRLVESLIVLLVMSFVVYGLIGLMPGDPIDLMVTADPHLTPADLVRLKALYGLDQPLLERYWNWLTAALGGDLGYSRLFALPVEAILLPRLANTLTLMGLAFAAAALIALPGAMLAARRPGGLADGAVNLAAFAGISLPPFWLAILLIMLFAVALGWLPAGGMGSGSLASTARHLALPVLALTLASVGGHLRYLRASLIEALRADHIRTARAKGLSEPQVIWRHALRNALIPYVTILALDFGTLFSGALITETIFGWLGMGKTIYDAIMGNDYNLALVGLLLATTTVLLANLLADLAYAWLDPRVSYR
ncbi:peptide/nickel transport system permease protein [Tistlia consotensis]|uniref:Peptide/nickel transport system permease protein n=1 Tax=Tistlia consotensis USBA 355 TaxID=560819 RepID=A0A1Y6B5B4_9PROT|nr:ABC transporter permease [Tistlia consotensis]SME88555.1 peptide/nickel transport system permease protein [Tistlia consotensis USBA 355]SNR25035.1 peptide/nickel transport system permease protein [Tistlia consotensis]